MDTGTGHIFEQGKVDLKNIKGDLVHWEVGQLLVVRGCQFMVEKIETFPEDKITLKGMANNFPVQ